MAAQPVLRLLFVLILTGLLAACSQDGAAIDFSQTEDQASFSPSLPSDDVIRMAVAPVLSPVPTFGLYQELTDYVADKLGRPVELIQGKTYQEINDLVKSGDVTLALVCTNPFLQGQEEFGMELLAAPEVGDQPYYYSLLVVRTGLDVNSLADLRGMTFAFTDPLSNSGRLAPLYQLALLGETPESFFSRAIFTYAHDNSIRAVADGLVDAAAVDSQVYEYLRLTDPDLMSKVKVVERWGPFGISPVVVNPNLDPELKARLREVFLEMDGDSQGRELLQRLLIDRFIVPDDSIYDSVRQMRAYLREKGLTE
jgi:phosphonate transport system substrate-binding protein